MVIITFQLVDITKITLIIVEIITFLIVVEFITVGIIKDIIMGIIKDIIVVDSLKLVAIKVNFLQILGSVELMDNLTKLDSKAVIK